LFSIVVTAYRNGPVLESWVSQLHQSLSTLEDPWEILLVANQWESEADPARDIAFSLEKKLPHVRTIALTKAGGYGWDVKTGLAAAQGQILGYIDGDGQISPESPLAAFRKITSENLDLVKARRVRREDGMYRRVLSKIFNLSFRFLFGIEDPDVNAKPKIFRKEIYEAMALRSDDWFLDAEIMIQAKQLNLKTGDFPISFHALSGRHSLVGFKTILEFCKNFWFYHFQKYKR
jgi:glycosyltransferase involved in cell wall biosynthesis